MKIEKMLLWVVLLLLTLGSGLKPGTLNAQTYEAKFDSMNASGWFGGDNRTNNGPRNIGVGQSVLIDSSITLDSFSFHFTNSFDFPQDPDGHGHEVTLTLNVRNSVGEILRTLQAVLPDTFDGGWVTWPGIALDVDADSSVIFITTYLVGAFDTNQYFSGHSGDQHASYEDGFRYVKGGTSDEDMALWDDWNRHSWDSAFMLQGTLRTVTSVDDGDLHIPGTFSLSQNYPNPFNPATTISYSLDHADESKLTIFDVLGRKVRTLVNARQQAGEYSVVWDGKNSRGHSIAGGHYFYQLQVGGIQSTRKMLLLK